MDTLSLLSVVPDMPLCGRIGGLGFGMTSRMPPTVRLVDLRLIQVIR
jgi:hypothetical protein